MNHRTSSTVPSTILLLLLMIIQDCHSAEKLPYVRPDFGRWIIPTVGQVWPMPQEQISSENFFVLQPDTFQFKVTGEKCGIIDSAIERYHKIIFYPGGKSGKSYSYSTSDHPQFKANLDSVEVNLTSPCEDLPHEDMIESYSIKIDTKDLPLKATIVSQSVWGILRGLETFSQLVYSSSTTGNAFQINGTEINDYPRFAHRGLLIDTARHFLGVSTLKKMTDLLAQNKMNVFHWHMTDDASFPWKSLLFPNMSLFGAYQPTTHVYSLDQVRDVIEYARIRGVRVIPEFDTPGHTHSWFGGEPAKLLTECYDDMGQIIPNKFGPINPVREENLLFLQKFFEEVTTVFKDKYVHMGGDEVNFTCWRTNPEVQDFMASNSWAPDDFGKLEQYYFERLMDLTQNITQNRMRYIVWQELVDDLAVLRNDTVVTVWKSEIDGADWHEELERITQFGYNTLLASPWYLNLISYGLDWGKYYEADPHDFNGTDAQKKLVIGGEAAMWGEYVDSVNLIPRTWPRASTIAERLWSAKNVNDTAKAIPRLEEHRCRLLHRGYNVDPSNGANFCDPEWDEFDDESVTVTEPPSNNQTAVTSCIFILFSATLMSILTY